jgi:hypothetical protein
VIATPSSNYSTYNKSRSLCYILNIVQSEGHHLEDIWFEVSLIRSLESTPCSHVRRKYGQGDAGMNQRMKDRL